MNDPHLSDPRARDRDPPTPGPMRRRGPRPLLLHLLLAMRSPSSKAAWPNWSGGSMPSFPLCDPTEILAADSELIAGIAAYRRHGWHRDLTEPGAIWQEGGSRLLDYGGGGPPVLFVPSLINRAHVLDLTRERSLMRWLAARGVRPLLLDWGWPGTVERGFSLTDYIAGRLERALMSVAEPVVLVGYCMGGLLTLAAALRRSDRVRALGLLATPWDFHAAADGMGQAARASLPMLEPVLAATGTLPVDALQSLFALADEEGVAERYRGFASLDPDSERARQFVALEDWLNDGVPLAAPVARECLAGWYGANTPAREAWRVAGEVVRPQALGCPTFLALPTRDRLVPPVSARALAARIGHAEVHEVPAGHIGMVAGGGAEAGLWAALLEWLRTV